MTNRQILGGDMTGAVAEQSRGISGAILYDAPERNYDLARTILHNLRGGWAAIRGFLELYAEENPNYVPMSEASHVFNDQLNNLLENYVKSSLIVGIDGAVFESELADLGERLGRIRAGVEHADTKSRMKKLDVIVPQLDRIKKSLQQISTLTFDSDYQLETEEIMSLELLVNARSSFEVAAAQKGITIVSEDRYRGNIYGNKTVIANLLENYVSNALKYTETARSDEQKTIKISMYEKDGNAVFEVSDQGIGMTQEEADRVFEKGYMADKSGAELSRLQLTGKDRKGIGLWLTKDIAERLGGRVYCTSEKGKGSTFYLELPTGT